MSAATAKFTPAKDYQGPAIELVCGKHDRQGKFHPKNVKLTSIARLRWLKDDGYDYRGTMSKYMIADDDVRNFAFSRADELAARHGWRAPNERP